ncbi:hypothetical protein Tcan_03067 [Toxocara canis]|uniref:Uncharacterized protein n=1 Tax=Toxocara canis TaxID=6265 RepID=A0A0B2V7I2_TOXCA|nr:hypothetical protein Tcan_03067 [Toxocara canis]
MARSIIDLDQTAAMEKIDECAELQTPFGRPPLRSMLSEPAGSIDDHNDLLCSHCRQNFRHFTGHEFYSVSYVSQFDREPLVMLNFALSPTSQTPPFDRAGFDGHFSPLVRMTANCFRFA